MLDGQIHQDVITKLWQVYSKTRCILSRISRSLCSGSSKQLPSEQRRGAIIVLGMLAIASRAVVSERVETLIKIGLGSLGKVNLFSRTSIPLNALSRRILSWQGIP
jgi:condensin complex subunit 1